MDASGVSRCFHLPTLRTRALTPRPHMPPTPHIRPRSKHACDQLTLLLDESDPGPTVVVLAATTVRDQQQWLAALRTVCSVPDQGTEDIYPEDQMSNSRTEAKRVTDLMRGRGADLVRGRPVRAGDMDGKRVTGAFDWVTDNPMAANRRTDEDSIFRRGSGDIARSFMKRKSTLSDHKSPWVRFTRAHRTGSSDASVFIRAMKRVQEWNR